MQRSLTDGATGEAVARFEKLVRNIAEDLSVVRDRVQSATVKAAREKDTRKCILLLGAILDTPGLADRLLEALQPHPSANGRNGKRGGRL